MNNAANLNSLVQGGQPYWAFPFSEASLVYLLKSRWCYKSIKIRCLSINTFLFVQALFLLLTPLAYGWRHDTQHNDIQHNNKKNLSLSKRTLSIMEENCYAECRLYWVSHVSLICWVSHVSRICSVSHISLTCWVSHVSLTCWVSHVSHICLVSHVSLICWVSLCWMPLCWVSWRRIKTSYGCNQFHIVIS